MTNTLPDPWDDAAAIARQLETGHRLVVAVGAEAWCTSCRTLKPVFHILSSETQHRADVFLWLDLEEHAEFLDDFIPPSLPFLLAYKRGLITHGVVVEDLTPAGLAKILELPQRIDHGALPNLDERFRTVDWSS